MGFRVGSLGRLRMSKYSCTGIYSRKKTEARGIHPKLISLIKDLYEGNRVRVAGQGVQPATNTQNSKPRPPTTNAKSKGKLQNKIKLKHC